MESGMGSSFVSRATLPKRDKSLSSTSYRTAWPADFLFRVNRPNPRLAKPVWALAAHGTPSAICLSSSSHSRTFSTFNRKNLGTSPETNSLLHRVVDYTHPVSAGLLISRPFSIKVSEWLCGLRVSLAECLALGDQACHAIARDNEHLPKGDQIGLVR